VASFEYDLTADDYAAFNLHHLMTSDVGRRQRRVYRLSLAGVTAVLSASLITVVLRDSVAALAAAAIGAMTGWFLGPFTWKREVRRNVRKMAKDDGLGASGRHVLTLDDYGIRENTPNATVTVPWSSLVRVDETADHLFIYTDPVRAFVVPVRIGAERVVELRELVSIHSAGSS